MKKKHLQREKTSYKQRSLTLFRLGGGGGEGGQKGTLHLRQTGVKFRVWTKCQSQIIELEPRPPLKKSGFSGQILIKLRL